MKRQAGQRRGTPTGTGSQGFTLVEILIVTLIMGIVALAISTLYISSQRTASQQLGVSDVQANLRVAMEAIARDIRTAGFLTAAAPVDTASDSGTLILQTAAYGNFARVAADSAPGSGTLTIASAEMAEPFGPQQSVRIIRPPRFNLPQNAIFPVDSVTGNQITISGLDPTVQIIQGDILVNAKAGAPAVHRIVYTRRASDNALLRQVDGGPLQVLARDITALDFQYVLASGQVHSVTVRLTGTADGPEGKVRELTSRVTIRNI